MQLKQHPTLHNIYVSPDGRVFRELVSSSGYGGYRIVEADYKVRVRAHVLVCETYHGERPAGAVVRHLDGDSGNDAQGNLAWGTQKENCEDTIGHGRSTKGVRNASAVLNRRKVATIRRRRAAGESGSSLAEEYGVSPATICDIVKRRTWL